MPRPISRAAFLYMDPMGRENTFAQCISCRFWRPNTQQCALFVPDIPVRAGASCGLYVYGPSTDQQPYIPSVFPKEAGLETREMRCINCTYYRDEHQSCHLYYTLNSTRGDIFDLDIHVHPHGCCNANTPKE